jgi:putative addiction module component (TIGR02574 family)
MTAKEIAAQAMTLPADERERLAGDLIQSLAGESLNEIDAAWVEEADRRYQAWQRGDTEGIPGVEVFEQIRRELGWSN